MLLWAETETERDRSTQVPGLEEEAAHVKGLTSSLAVTLAGTHWKG